MPQRAIMLVTAICLVLAMLVILALNYGFHAAICGALAAFGTLILCVSLEVGHEFN